MKPGEIRNVFFVADDCFTIEQDAFDPEAENGFYDRRISGWTVAIVVYATAFYVFVYGPIALIGIFSFNSSEVTGLPFQHATTHWYQVVLARDDLMAYQLGHRLGSHCDSARLLPRSGVPT